MEKIVAVVSDARKLLRYLLLAIRSKTTLLTDATMAKGSSDCHMTKCEVAFLILGAFLVLGGITLQTSRLPEKFVQLKIQNQLVVSPNSTMLDAWVNPIVPIYMKFYVFNVTNADAIVRGENPVLTQHGPYTYRMIAPRYDIEFFSNNTVAFRNNNTLHFERNMSSGSENDMLYHINIPLVTVSEKLSKLPYFVREVLRWLNVYNTLLNMIGNEELVVPHTVKEIIFGYQDGLLVVLNEVLSAAGRKGVDTTFGPFHGFNNSDDGLYLVKTGKADFGNFNEIVRWNGKPNLPYWSTEDANMINGTDGSFLKPLIHRNDTRYIYFSQMLRSLKLEYEQDSRVKGITTYRYHFANNLLASGYVDSDNTGFCVPVTNCYESGVLDVGNCEEQTAPIFLSLPHFYNGDESLYENIVGLSPNKTLHDSFFHAEPMTGAVLLSERRLQMNVHVTPGSDFRQFEYLRPVFFPYFWLSGEATASNDIAKDLRIVVLAMALAFYVGYILIAIGVVISLATMLYRYSRRKVVVLSDDEEPLTDNHSSGSVPDLDA